MALHVIGAGLGRTGTLSLKLALEQLGLGPCHHMYAVIADAPVQVPLWTAAAAGKPDWNAALSGFNSAVDWPGAAFWRELAEANPAAKVILTVRSVESWHESFSGTIDRLLAARADAPPHMQALLAMGVAVITRTGIPLGGTKPELMKAFIDHTARVKAAIPPERLLVFDVKEGWPKLCDFLGKPVPDEPFPRTNTAQDFWARIKGAP